MSMITRYWYQKSLHPLLFFLLPFSWLFRLLVSIRRKLYSSRILQVHHFSVPIIIVGNITVGGTGKTPFVMWLVQCLQANGFKPGIVSRGVGSRGLSGIHWVKANDLPEKIGDEALLIQRTTKVPMVIGKKRVDAVAALLEQTDCNIIVSDDGLQHYSLGRAMEIMMVDGERLFGNERLLPAGPLRESINRLTEVDFVIYNSTQLQLDRYSMSVTPHSLVSLHEPNQHYTTADFPWRRIHAVAGIGNPDRFFKSLRMAGFEIITHQFPDHYHYTKQDFAFPDTLPIIMTEKDAVKCRAFADQRFWCQHVNIDVSDLFKQRFFQKLSAMETY